MNKVNVLLGIIALSYFIHLESVIIPCYLGYCYVIVALSCIVWCTTSMISLILLIIRLTKTGRDKTSRSSEEDIKERNRIIDEAYQDIETTIRTARMCGITSNDIQRFVTKTLYPTIKIT